MATRIGVFFDGTGNNMWNDMAIGDGSQSNIAKLYQLFSFPSSRWEYIVRLCKRNSKIYTLRHFKLNSNVYLST